MQTQNAENLIKNVKNIYF